MSFYEYYRERKESIEFGRRLASVKPEEVLAAAAKPRLTEDDFLLLLSPAAGIDECLEAMAQKASHLTRQNFGWAMLLYTPLYISNHCVNRCLYCSFSTANRLPRRTLRLEDIVAEARAIAATGLRHLLVLTGESRQRAPDSYLREAIGVLRPHFASLGIEVYPLEEEEYAGLIHSGVDSLTIYQEVYDEGVYDQVHQHGPKKNYHYRMEAPERACRAGIRSVHVGALLGLNDWRREAFFAGIHAAYLERHFPGVEINISLPRLRPHLGEFKPLDQVSDRDLVQILIAMRIYLPRAGLTISTRERPQLRDSLLPLGVTRISAGSCTEVGGWSQVQRGYGQFEVADRRSVAEIRQMLLAKGYRPVSKDWLDLGQQPV